MTTLDEVIATQQSQANFLQELAAALAQVQAQQQQQGRQAVFAQLAGVQVTPGRIPTLGGGGSTPTGKADTGYPLLPANAITGREIGPGAIDVASLFASSIVPPQVVAALPSLPNASFPNGSIVFLTTDQKLYRNASGTWSKAVDGGDIMVDTITAGSIAAGAIGADAIAANAVTADKLTVGLQNLIDNPDFETGDLTGWSVVAASGGSAVVDTTNPPSGKYRCLITTGAAVGEAILGAAYIPAAPAQDFVLSAMLSSGATAMSTQLKMFCYDASKAVLGSVFTTVTAVAGSPVRYASDVLTTLASTAFVRFAVVASTASASLAVDDVVAMRGGVIIDSSGITVLNGRLTLQDQYGASVLDANGVQGSLATFIADGLYNAQLRSVTAGAIADGRTSSLPFWSVSRVGLTSLTGVADTSWPGAHYVEAVPAASGDKVIFVSDRILVTPQVPVQISATLGFVSAGGGPTLAAFLGANWYKADGTAIGSTLVDSTDLSGAGTSPPHNVLAPVLIPPDGSAAAAVIVELKEAVAHSASSRMRFGGASIRPAVFVGSGPPLMTSYGRIDMTFAASTTISPGNAIAYYLTVPVATQVNDLLLALLDTSGSHSLEWRLYASPDNQHVLTQIDGFTGSAIYTGVPGGEYVAAPPVGIDQSLAPGTYWLVIRNRSATTDITLRAQGPGVAAYLALGFVFTAPGALGPTFDMDTHSSTTTGAALVFFRTWSPSGVLG